MNTNKYSAKNIGGEFWRKNVLFFFKTNIHELDIVLKVGQLSILMYYKQVLIRADQPPAAAVLLAEGEEAASTRAASTLLYSERKRGIESRAPVSTTK